ncbi:hypothetical protein AQUCO_02700063v1 [Aquilegia coerulea]|uniref:MLO-like protein n=1 Tax=Aquilegia coerulea TaxID=218851 RepID=A0A2G5D502_AQUCA|nr:hypothetical protein AQUCO_02700063v1 [Aquilegia coerulea]
MAVEATNSSSSLLDTPTWAVAVVFFVLITISIALEQSIHYLHTWLKRHHKKALIDALDKLQSELMLVGFISLLLATSQRSISNICIPTKVANSMLPCHKTPKSSNKSGGFETSKNGTTRHKLFSIDRRLAGSESAVYDHCVSKGMVSLISQDGLNQLHRFIFILAAVHVAFSVFTMALGSAKMKRWKSWEKETQTTDYQVANDPNRFRYARQTTFGRRHMNLWTETSLHLWIKCFFRQFFQSVAKVDYLTLRHGFIAIHNSNSTFDFQKYIKRSLEDDFKVVVGISPPLWFLVVSFLLFDVHGWNVYLWLSFVPLVIMLVMGTKLEVIVTRMALRVKNQSSVVKGSPLVQPNDELFWFGHPRFLLHFLHLTLFLNAFEVAFFIWISYEFGLKSCYHENIEIITTRVVVAVIVQVLCSYITLPLYALITQMGSQYKSTILDEQTANLMKNWHRGAKRNLKKHEKNHQQEEQSHFPSSSHYVADSSNHQQEQSHFPSSSHYEADSSNATTTAILQSSSPSLKICLPIVAAKISWEETKSNDKDIIEEEVWHAR